MNSNEDSVLQKLMGEIEQDRERLKLQAHLLKADTKDEWDKVEKKWHHFKGHSHHVGQEARVASKDLLAATQILAEEIKVAYKRIMRSL
ncbi:MAG: hypothetical protein ACI88A_004369 [Paraglaciecola sp.]|jgi:hypothetical protein